MTFAVVSSYTWGAETRCTSSAFKTECSEPDLEPHRQKSRHSIKLEGVTIKRELKAPVQELASEQHCVADIQISYMQMNEQIRVDATVDTDRCGPSSGEFDLSIRTYTETEQGSEPITRTVNEVWQRDNETPLELRKHYSMAGATRLGWVRVKTNPDVACLCRDTINLQ